jgi:hypothetical protein
VNIDYYKTWQAGQRQDFNAALKWLDAHGESVDQAKEDLKRWNSWSPTNGEYAKNMAAEVAERKAREAAEKQQAAAGEDGNGDK